MQIKNIKPTIVIYEPVVIYFIGLQAMLHNDLGPIFDVVHVPNASMLNEVHSQSNNVCMLFNISPRNEGALLRLSELNASEHKVPIIIYSYEEQDLNIKEFAQTEIFGSFHMSLPLQDIATLVRKSISVMIGM